MKSLSEYFVVLSRFEAAPPKYMSETLSPEGTSYCDVEFREREREREREKTVESDSYFSR
jgi:hypothetical protein